MKSTDASVADLLPFASPEDGGDIDTLHDRLAAAADRAGLLDVAYRTVDSPIGGLLLAATGDGLVRIAFQSEGFDDVLAALSGAISPRILRGTRRLDEAARQLDEYFDGARERFELPLDTRLSSGFRRRVLEYLPRIGYGETASYRAVALAVGNPRAVRAVGTACATNPLPLVVPCHRVVRSDGLPGMYRGGPECKRQLLGLEGRGGHVSAGIGPHVGV